MAIIFAEGFDHYGTYEPDESGRVPMESTARYNMLNGVWAEVPDYCSVYYAGTVVGYGLNEYDITPRTGRGCVGISTGLCTGYLRRSLGGNQTTVGVAFAFWISQLPQIANRHLLIGLFDGNTRLNIAALLQPDGRISIVKGDEWNTASIDFEERTALISETDPGVVAPGNWVHVELKTVINATTGSVGIKINEEERLEATVSGINTIGTYYTGVSPGTNSSSVSQIGFLYCGSGDADALPFFIDDIVVWDGTGAGNIQRDYIGDKNVVAIPFAFDNSDNALLDATGWEAVGTGGAANRKEAIDDFNETPYSRDDDTYLVASDVNDVVGFKIDGSATISDIDAAIVITSQRKTQASTTKTQVTVNDGSDQDGVDRAIAQNFTYYEDIFELDSSGDKWNIAALNNAVFKITRTT